MLKKSMLTIITLIVLAATGYVGGVGALAGFTIGAMFVGWVDWRLRTSIPIDEDLATQAGFTLVIAVILVGAMCVAHQQNTANSDPDGGGIGAAGAWARNLPHDAIIGVNGQWVDPGGRNNRGVLNVLALKVKNILSRPQKREGTRSLWSVQQVADIAQTLSTTDTPLTVQHRIMKVIQEGPLIRTPQGKYYDWLQARELAEAVGGFPIWSLDSSTPPTATTTTK